MQRDLPIHLCEAHVQGPCKYCPDLRTGALEELLLLSVSLLNFVINGWHAGSFLIQVQSLEVGNASDSTNTCSTPQHQKHMATWQIAVTMRSNSFVSSTAAYSPWNGNKTQEIQRLFTEFSGRKPGLRVCEVPYTLLCECKPCKRHPLRLPWHANSVPMIFLQPCLVSEPVSRE